VSELRVGLVQLRTPATQAAALSHATPLVRQAAGEGAEFILTPECTNMVQRDRAKSAQIITTPENDACVQGLSELAGELKVWLLIGSALVKRPDGATANRSMLIGPDGVVFATYDKIHMFDVDLPTGESVRESEAFAPGAEAIVARTPWGGVGLTICYDMRFPYLYRALAKSGATILTAPAAFTRPTGEAHWEVLLRARAIENGAFVLAPAQGGTHEDGRGTWGHSIVVGPWGEVLARADNDEPGVIMATLDLEAAPRARKAIPALANERRFTGPRVAA
jgi:deaminated glutathione amidase